jgi:hypothetical protein
MRPPLRETVVRAAVLVLATIHPALAKPSVCPEGRFVQATRILPGAANESFDAVIIQNGQIAIASGCDPARVHLKATRKGTRVRAAWRRCGDLRRVRLSGTIVEDGEPCRRLIGTLRAKKTDASALSATRTTCGDTIIDPARETCDPPGSTCSAQCQIEQSTGPDPIVAPARTWTWVPFDDAFCANGSTTGIGVNPADAGARVFIFLMGGGACWDELTCYTLKTASFIESGYGKPQFDRDAAGLLTGSFFDRSDSTNPFRNDSFVFVPYCTGDVHAGSKPDAQYGTHVTRHVGFQNMTAFLRRLVPTFSGATRVILSGSSAGGYGALTNWWQTQQAFGALRVDLIDDSGPPLPAPYLSATLEQTWRTAWNLAAATPAGCTACADDLDAILGFYGTNLVGHRAALLSYTQDGVIGAFFLLPGPQVEAGLGVLADTLAPYDVWRYFYVTGSSHTMLGTPDLAQNGVTVRTFLTQMLSDDPAWTSVEP